MDRFFAAIDISEQVGRGLGAVRSMQHPLTCLILAAILAAINIGLWPIIWYLDLDSTRAFGEDLADVMRASGAPMDPTLFGWALLVAILIPTLVEMGAPVLARFGVSVAQWLCWFVLCLDAYTDYPRVAALLAPKQAAFTASLGDFLGTGLFWLAKAVALFFASLGLELWFVVTSVLILALLLKALAGRGRRAVASP